MRRPPVDSPPFRSLVAGHSADVHRAAQATPLAGTLRSRGRRWSHRLNASALPRIAALTLCLAALSGGVHAGGDAYAAMLGYLAGSRIDRSALRHASGAAAPDLAQSDVSISQAGGDGSAGAQLEAAATTPAARVTPDNGMQRVPVIARALRGFHHGGPLTAPGNVSDEVLSLSVSELPR